MREALANLFKGNKLPAFVQPMNLIRNIVATIDNLPRSKAAPRLWPVQPTPGRLSTINAGDSLVIAPDNSARYAPVVALVHAIDTKQLVAIYVRFYPLFQQAYRELGYPDGYFNDRLVAVIDHLIAPVQSVYALAATHIDERIAEDGRPYRCTAEDAAYAIFELEGGVVAQLNSSWCVRVDRDELFELQVDGTAGSAVAGLRDCRLQTRARTPRAIWNPDLPNPLRFRDGWETFGAEGDYDNAFKAQWEQYLRHVAGGTPFAFDLFDGARGVQLAELAERSWRERRALAVPELPA